MNRSTGVPALVVASLALLALSTGVAHADPQQGEPPARTQVVGFVPKAQVEYEERVAAGASSVGFVPKAQVEYEERVAAGASSVGFVPKAQVEYEERVAAQAASGPSPREQSATPPTDASGASSAVDDVPWQLLMFVGLGAVGLVVGALTYRANHLTAREAAS